MREAIGTQFSRSRHRSHPVKYQQTTLYFPHDLIQVVWSDKVELTSEQSLQAHVLFQKKIEPNDVVAAELGNVISDSPTPKSIFVFVVFSTYYREGDMERFENRSTHFFDNGKVFDLAGFMPHPDFDKISPFINTVRPPDWASLIRDLPAEMVIHKPRADQNDAERTTNNPKNQDDTRQPLPAPSDIRIIFTDE